MRLVMTLLVRDEADIVDAHLSFHLNAGVDYFIATDHASSDGTTEILERYAAQGVLRLIHESDTQFLQSRWVTRMARLAATNFGADWVINSDADEFWWPSGGDLKTVLSLVPERFGVLHTFVRAFLPRSGSGPFSERLIVRLTPNAAINDPATSFRVSVRLCHRASPTVVVATGNAGVTGTSFVPMRGWTPLEVLHFPIRSYEQFERKFLSHFASVGGRRVDHGRAHQAAASGRLRELYEEIYVAEEHLPRALGSGSVVVDTRLRDALRTLAAEQGQSLVFPQRAVVDNVAIALDRTAVDEAELVRLSRHVDELARRLAMLDVPTNGISRSGVRSRGWWR